MNPISSTLISRLATLLFSAALLSGCFGTGEGPDRIEGTLAPPPPPIPPGFCDPLFNFEDLCGAVTFNNFEGGEAAIIDNPDPSGSNTSDKVARMLKFRGPDEDTFGGTSIPLDGSFDFANGTAFTMQVWASRSVPVLFKFEGLNQERSLDHSGSSGWEELCFDFTGSTAGNAATSLTVIFDISVMGDAEANPNDWTFYFDEIVQVASCDGGGDPGDGSAPTVGAPAPTQDAANVISLYSDAYTDEAVVWPTDWSDPNNTTSDITIDGGLVKEALDISFFGIEFQVDASSMTHLHMDVWTPDATSLVLKLVDFGGDGFGGMNADTEGVLTFDAASTPALGQGTWVSLDIPLQDFLDIGLGSTADLNQIVVDPGPDGTDLFIDNVYFYNDNAGDGGNAPTTSAPTPTQAAGSVISLYSDVYTDEVVTWPTPWSDPNDTTSDVTIDGGLVKEHLNVNFFGIEFQVDGSSMTHLHMDVWTPDADSLLLKLVDFGGDGFGGMNADTEGVLTFDAASTPALGQGTWVSLDIPLQDFLDNGLGSTADLNQIVVDPTPDGTALYFDNVYFYDATAGDGGNAPTTSAPTPTQAAGSVISLYSDAYTDEAVVWPTPWSDPNDTTSDVTIDGGLVKEHLNVNFFGIEFQVDGSSMTHLHMDVWTPDATSLVLKLVDFGGDGFGGMNADTEGVLTFDAASTPALGQGTWVSLDIPLQDFLDNGLGSTADLNQIVVDPTPDGTALYIDNVYFYDANAGGDGAFVNGNFETGDFTGWTLEQIPPDRGSITLDSSGQGGRAGTVARLMAAGDASGTNDVLISQVALGAGTIVSGDTIDVSFDLYGSLTGAGGVVFVEVIFLNAAGEDEGGRNFVGPAAPYTPTSTWTNHSGTVIAGTGVNSSGWDVSGGVTLQLKAACGAIAGGCGVDASFDNVTFTVNGE